MVWHPGERERERGHGAVTFTDLVNSKYPIDSAERGQAARRSLHQRDNTVHHSKGEVVTIERRIKQAAKRFGGEVHAD